MTVMQTGTQPADSADVICVGLIVADLVCAPIRKFPAEGGLITTEGIELTIGGCAANVSTDLAKVDVSVALVGCVGNDPLGRNVLAELRSNGVNCDAVRESETAQTATTMVVNIQGQDRRFIHAVGANTELSGAEVSDALLENARVLYVGGFGLNPELSGDNVRALFERAQQRSVTTILDVVLDDVEACRTMLKQALPATEIVLPNQDEARLLTDLTDPDRQADCFLNWGASAVVVTQGAEGALYRDQHGNRYSQPAFPVDQVDGTGGGDAFASGYIYALLQGASPARCLVYGSAMGASCVRRAGATTGVFRRDELEQFVSGSHGSGVDLGTA